ncbi:MAG: DUF4136 domain-containing protein [Gammaproteobacteria bacterium]|nr:MAG: DUF4136 domain-containing protein [Gammaproteobacteria bacterium]
MNALKVIIRSTSLVAVLILGMQQQVMAAENATTNTMPKFLATTSSAPYLSITKSSRFSWLFEDVDIKADAPVTKKGIQTIVKEEIEKVMLTKGLTVAESGKPSDFFIAYTAATESTLDDDMLFKRYKISPGYKVPNDGSQVYEKGTLLIHVINANTRQTVWQSAAQGGVQENISDAQRRININKIVTVMLRGLPVK